MKVSRNTITWASVSFSLATLSLFALAGCPVTGDDLCAGGTCAAASPTGDGAPPQDGGADAIVEQPTDPCVDKPTASECLTNASALFVSASANPAGADGTFEHPYVTISAAVQKVTNEKRRIYVCEGTYAEQVALEGLPMTLIGGLACDFKSKGAKPKIAPASGVALSIAAVGGTSVIDVAVEGTTPPNTPGASAIGIFVTRAKNILLRGVDVKTTDGQAGANGNEKINWTGLQPLPNSPNGGAGGGPPACVKCTDMTSSFGGGGGSTAGASGGLPEGGAAQPPVNGTNQANSGGNGAPCFPGTVGADGEPAAKATGADRPGILQQSAWNTEATAKAGGNGGPAQGGGGGGANASEGGGSGGCGGCGGGGGTNGSNGGSSIALLVYSSELRIEKSSFTAGSGGKGGDGAKGQDGQSGRVGGAATCVGGTGGGGAGGGGGGGGAGGHSLAIGYVGDEPQRTETTLAKATAGLKGVGGDPGGSPGGTAKGGFPGDPGTDGRSEEVLDLE